MSNSPFGISALVAVGLYLVAMIVLGLLAQRLRRRESLSEFYLASKSLGTMLLLLTLYATQYSGNSLLGYPGEAYRVGYLWIMSIGFMMSVVIVYLLFAPEIYRISRQQHFVTPGDWIDYRFRFSQADIGGKYFILVGDHELSARPIDGDGTRGRSVVRQTLSPSGWGSWCSDWWCLSTKPWAECELLRGPTVPRLSC